MTKNYLVSMAYTKIFQRCQGYKKMEPAQKTLGIHTMAITVRFNVMEAGQALQHHRFVV